MKREALHQLDRSLRSIRFQPRASLQATVLHRVRVARSLSFAGLWQVWGAMALAVLGVAAFIYLLWGVFLEL